MARMWLLVGIGLAFGLSACGETSDDDGGAAQCGGFTPCGGDPVGDWQFVDLRNFDPNAGLDDDYLDDPACQALFQNWDFDVDLTLSLRPDGTVS